MTMRKIIVFLYLINMINLPKIFCQESFTMFNAGDSKDTIEKIINMELRQISEESFFIDNWPMNNVSFNFYINNRNGLWAVSQTIIVTDHDIAMQLFENIFDLILDNFGEYNDINDLDKEYKWEGNFINNIWKIRLKKFLAQNYVMITLSIEFNTSPAYK